MKENGFTLNEARNRRYPAQIITDADYAYDIALFANTPTQAIFLLHSVTRCIAIRFRLCWRHSDDLFVLARNTHKGPEDEISRKTGIG